MSDTTDSRKEKFDSTYHDNFVKAVQRFAALYQGNSDKPAFEKCSFMLSHLFEKPGTNLFETLKFEDLVIIHKLLAEQNYDIKLLSWCLDKCTNVDLVVKPDAPFPTYSVVFTFTVNEGARITLTHNVVHGVIDSVSLNDQYGENLHVYPGPMTFIDVLYSFYHGKPKKEDKVMTNEPNYLERDLQMTANKQTEITVQKFNTPVVDMTEEQKTKIYLLNTATNNFCRNHLSNQKDRIGLALPYRLLKTNPGVRASDVAIEDNFYLEDFIVAKGENVSNLITAFNSCVGGNRYTVDEDNYGAFFTFEQTKNGVNKRYSVCFKVADGIILPSFAIGDLSSDIDSSQNLSFFEVLRKASDMSDTHADVSQEPEEYVHVLDNGKTETETQRMARMEAALEVVLDIGSRDYGGGLVWVDYLRDAMKFRVFMHKFNNTNFAKHLGLSFSHEGHIVMFCGHRVSQLKYFLTNHYSFFKPGGLDMFETFGEIAVNPSSEFKPKKAKLNVNHQHFVFTVLDLNGKLEKETLDDQDLKIKFSVFPHDLRGEWLNYNGVENIPEEPTARDDYQISLLEYLSYLNSQFVKTAESRA